MKIDKRIKLKIYLGLFLLQLFSACKTSTVMLDVLQPAAINVPSHIKKIAVEDRARASKDEKFMNILEGTLTGEGIGMDRDGAEKCISGLLNTLGSTPRFTILHGGITLYGTGTGELPEALDWSEVQKICKNDFADALLVLEAFDSNSNVDVESKQEVIKHKDGSSTISNYFIATKRVSVKNCWRLYDPATKNIIDEICGNDYKEFSARGENHDQAIHNLISEWSAVEQAGYFAGQNYGVRIAPVWIKVSRSYYVKGNDQLEKAAEMANVKDWDNAIAIWKGLTTYPDPKIAGRAAHNMAVASEVQGSLTVALDWAKKAAYDYNNKYTLSYIRILNERMSDQERLDHQMQD